MKPVFFRRTSHLVRYPSGITAGTSSSLCVFAGFAVRSARGARLFLQSCGSGLSYAFHSTGVAGSFGPHAYRTPYTMGLPGSLCGRQCDVRVLAAKRPGRHKNRAPALLPWKYFVRLTRWRFCGFASFCSGCYKEENAYFWARPYPAVSHQAEGMLKSRKFGQFSCSVVPSCYPGKPDKMVSAPSSLIFGLSHRRARDLTFSWRVLRNHMAFSKGVLTPKELWPV